ncbi:MAG: HAD family hydrolase [Candidatus Eremiobacteraeota bacterium]|nr:HAD family hydrolase [Candidatus Eremiobacteraeota bacterium]
MKRAILFDRDGTLIVDRPGNSDPAALALMPGAADALALARENGWSIGVITNQPSIADGSLDRATLSGLHSRIEELAGPIDGWFVCAHGASDRCGCRKPEPGLIFDAATFFGVDTERFVVVGDIFSDIAAARAAGAPSVLVPTPVTLPNEIEAAPVVARDILEAVKRIVGGSL